MGNAGAHGFTEMLYAYTSNVNGNGSAMAGFNGNTMFYNLTMTVGMFVGRYLPIVFVPPGRKPRTATPGHRDHRHAAHPRAQLRRLLAAAR